MTRALTGPSEVSMVQRWASSSQAADSTVVLKRIFGRMPKSVATFSRYLRISGCFEYVSGHSGFGANENE